MCRSDVVVIIGVVAVLLVSILMVVINDIAEMKSKKLGRKYYNKVRVILLVTDTIVVGIMSFSLMKLSEIDVVKEEVAEIELSSEIYESEKEIYEFEKLIQDKVYDEIPSTDEDTITIYIEDYQVFN